MNVHPDCQEGVPKCQPKSRLLRRQKSASEIDSRIVGVEDDSEYFIFGTLKWIWRKSRRDRESYFTLIPFLAIPTTTTNTSTVWRRHSVRSLHSYSSFEHSYPQALGLDPREPDPVYVTLREAARKRSDTGRKKRHLHHRRRCYSENGVTNTTNKMKNQPQLANGILFLEVHDFANRVGWCDFLTFCKVSDFCY